MGKKYKISFREASKLIFLYAKKRLAEQLKAVAAIVVFLIVFQTIVLKIALTDASVIALGMVLVVIGLAFFLEGLMLGLMPLGGMIGIKLPKKTNLTMVLLIAFVLGLGATFAEPAIGVLKVAGQSVKAWEAPLLFIFLNRFSNYLVYGVGIGVGFAVMLGTLRFLYGWSLKPLIYIVVSLLLALSFYAYKNPNLYYLLGLAWDCGGVTTGPVTVPLILALGIGISQVTRKSGEKSGSGFGVVTIASLLPIITVLIMGIIFEPKLPNPMPANEFVSVENRAKSEYLFNNSDEFKGYILKHTDYQAQLALFDDDPEKLINYLQLIYTDEELLNRTFGNRADFERWLIAHIDNNLKIEVFGSIEKLEEAIAALPNNISSVTIEQDIFKRNTLSAAQAIIPLSLFLLMILIFIIRERLPKVDEMLLGILFSIIGLAVFFGGLELGLAKMGDQVGRNLPTAFKEIEIHEEQIIIDDFEYSLVRSAVEPEGSIRQFFYLYDNNKYSAVEFKNENYLQESQKYMYTPTRGPLFGGKELSFAGLLIVLIFAFLVGYGATLAEPALCALGLTVEEITVGTFKKSLLVQTVAIGVGFGIAAGVSKIIWDLPLFWMLAPPYLILLIITMLSTEEYVNIGWDAAGVTTGPITVPLVITMGLGISSQVGIIEGFGVLSLASLFPIFSVLTVGLVVNHKRNKTMQELSSDKEEELAIEKAI